MMDYSFLAARLSFTFMYTCIFFSWQINSAAATQTSTLLQNAPYLHMFAMQNDIVKSEK